MRTSCSLITAMVVPYCGNQFVIVPTSNESVGAFNEFIAAGLKINPDARHILWEGRVRGFVYQFVLI